MLNVLNLDELEAKARERLDPMLFDYIAGGAADEWTLAENRAAWSRFQLLPRMLRGVADRSMATTVLGTPISMPVVVPPMGFQGLCHAEARVRDGARDGRRTHDLLREHRVERQPRGDRESVRRPALVPAVRLQRQGHHARSRRARRGRRLFARSASRSTRRSPARANATGATTCGCRVISKLANFPESHTAMHHRGAGPGSSLAQYITAQWDPALTWKDVEWLRSISPMPVVVKGVLAADDAVLAVDHGAAAIVVSNHGGRQLDGVPAPASRCSPPSSKRSRVADRAKFYVDGGARRGTDVLSAIALGARAVMIGRPILWGLTLDGADGVRAVLQRIRAEIDLSMALAGCATLADVTADLISSRE